MSRPRNLLKNSQLHTFPKKSLAPHYLTNSANGRPARLTGKNFRKSSRRPGSLGKTKKKQTTKQAGHDGQIGNQAKSKTPHPHFHIFESLPGLNGLAHNGRGDYEFNKSQSC